MPLWIVCAQLLRLYAKKEYTAPMPLEQTTLGEYMRRLRRAKGWSLMNVAEDTKLSYSHLSRIENDSTIPSADTVVKIAGALDGDLELMLQLAGRLPKVIVDRITVTAGDGESTRLLRSANTGGSEGSFPSDLRALAELLQRQFGLPENQARELAIGIDALARFSPDKRTALVSFLQAERGDAGGRPR